MPICDRGIHAKGVPGETSQTVRVAPHPALTLVHPPVSLSPSLSAVDCAQGELALSVSAAPTSGKPGKLCSDSTVAGHGENKRILQFCAPST